MLIALSLKNFKSIAEARVRFGPLTCLIGRNGTGKSNLFDAIHLLSELAYRDSSKAVAAVGRAGTGRCSPLDLIHRRDPDRAIEFSADMIVQPDVEDDFGEPGQPSTTLLTYTLKLRYEPDSDRLVVEYESLTHGKLGDYREFVGFHSSPDFKGSVALGSRRGGPLISTKDDQIMLHGDDGSHGRLIHAGRSSRTVVGGTNSYDYPTALAAKREMSSWRVLRLEPTAMRVPDTRGVGPERVSTAGGRIPATLHALTTRDPEAQSQIVNRLRRLDSDIAEVGVRVDEAGDQLALQVRMKGVEGWLHGASLPDSTLRFLALTLMLTNVRDRGALCIEEPENGIHPSRIPDLVQLLRDYAVDTQEMVSADNPLRQVIINTHSPEVARQLSIGDIVVAQRVMTGSGGPVTVFRPIEGTWRTDLAQGEEPQELPISQQAVIDFIGGSPVGKELGQLRFTFGTA